jgi:phosphatidylglycerol---prolipoprotein diacylglyceryl transferase
VFPILFHLGPVQVHSYGVMLMLGFLAGIALSQRQARRMGLSPDLPIDLGVWILVFAIVLSRLVFVALNWSESSHRLLDIVGIWREGGLSFHGGLLGGILATLLYGRLHKLSFWVMADLLSPGLALGYALARIGCFLNGCCYGETTTLPWGVVFPGITTDPCHPTQLYSSLGSLIILALLLRVQPRLKARGQLFATYLILYTILRGIVEIFRSGATGQVVFGPITQAQVASVIILALALYLYSWLGRKGERVAPPSTRRSR